LHRQKEIFFSPQRIMDLAVSILILFILSFQVMPVALGINHQKSGWFQASSMILILVAAQLLFFLLGIWLGNRFMYLISGIQKGVLFVGFFLIGVRFSMEAFKVRKGERTYLIQKTNAAVLPAVGQSMNTLLAGVLFYFIQVDLVNDLIYLGVFSFSLSLLFVLLKSEKMALSAISLLYMLDGGLLSLVSIYFAFV
jgi:putative Mn2+ efflux pump MntP